MDGTSRRVFVGAHNNLPFPIYVQHNGGFLATLVAKAIEDHGGIVVQRLDDAAFIVLVDPVGPDPSNIIGGLGTALREGEQVILDDNWIWRSIDAGRALGPPDFGGHLRSASDHSEGHSMHPVGVQQPRLGAPAAYTATLSGPPLPVPMNIAPVISQSGWLTLPPVPVPAYTAPQAANQAINVHHHILVNSPACFIHRSAPSYQRTELAQSIQAYFGQQAGSGGTALPGRQGGPLTTAHETTGASGGAAGQGIPSRTTRPEPPEDDIEYATPTPAPSVPPESESGNTSIAQAGGTGDDDDLGDEEDLDDAEEGEQLGDTSESDEQRVSGKQNLYTKSEVRRMIIELSIIPNASLRNPESRTRIDFWKRFHKKYPRRTANSYTEYHRRHTAKIEEAAAKLSPALWREAYTRFAAARRRLEPILDMPTPKKKRRVLRSPSASPAEGGTDGKPIRLPFGGYSEEEELAMVKYLAENLEKLETGTKAAFWAEFGKTRIGKRRNPKSWQEYYRKHGHNFDKMVEEQSGLTKRPWSRKRSKISNATVNPEVIEIDDSDSDEQHVIDVVDLSLAD